MKPLDLLEILALANSKSLRDAAVPAEYGKLSSLVERLQADVPGTLATVLRDEAGIEWDGTAGTCWATVIEEAKRQSAIEAAIAGLTGQRNEMATLEAILRRQQIAGRGNVDAALAKLKNWKAQS